MNVSIQYFIKYIETGIFFMSDSLIMLQRIGKINKGTELYLPDDIFYGNFRQKLYKRGQGASRTTAARPAQRGSLHGFCHSLYSSWNHSLSFIIDMLQIAPVYWQLTFSCLVHIPDAVSWNDTHDYSAYHKYFTTPYFYQLSCCMYNIDIPFRPHT